MLSLFVHAALGVLTVVLFLRFNDCGNNAHYSWLGGWYGSGLDGLQCLAGPLVDAVIRRRKCYWASAALVRQW